MRYTGIFAALLPLLSACVGSGQPGTSTAAHAPDEAAASAGMEVRQGPAAGRAALRPFPPDSIYPLLVAEFALRRQDYGTALHHYLRLAPRLRDPEISAQTTRLAQYLERDEQALEAATLWLELAPDNLLARLTLANLLADQGRGGDALPHMAMIVRAGGRANFSVLHQGFARLDDSAKTDTLTAIGELLEEFPNDTQLLICRSLMLATLDQKERALQQLQPVFDLDPESLQALVLDASLRQQLALGENPYQRLEAALQSRPEWDQLRRQYAKLLSRTDLDAARRQYLSLLETSPVDPELLLPLALIQRESGQLDEAREHLEKVAELLPERFEAHYFLGEITERQRHYEQSLQHYLRVPPGPAFLYANRNISRILLNSERWSRHREHFNGMRAQYPEMQLQFYLLEANSLHAQGLYSRSIELLNRALEELPEQTDLQYLRSMAWEKLGDLTRMEADLRAILRREPANSIALNALGYVLANRTTRYLEAQQLIERALQLEPEEPAYLDSFGWVRYQLGDHRQALQYLRRAYREFPDPEVAAHLGEVLWSTGQTEEAIGIWEAALSADPGHEIVLETMRRLGASDPDS